MAVLVICGWLGVAGLGGPTFGRLDEVQQRDQAAFLPASAEATKALDWQAKFRDSDAVPAIVLIESDEALAPAAAGELLKALNASGLVSGTIAGPIPAEDGKALQLIVPVTPDVKTSEAIATIREVVRESATGLPGTARGYVTGPAGFVADLIEAFSGIDGLLLVVALVAVLAILLVVYRSALLPVIVLFTSVAALCAAIVAVFWMASWGWITLDGQSQGILSILVIGAATDYALLYVSRFREALVAGHGRYEATWTAVRGSVEPILASAGTVIAGLMCLLFSDLNSNKALGPIAASGIVFSVLANLTLLPAALSLAGRAGFWPFMPKVRGAASDPAKAHPRGIWHRIADWVAKRPRPIWVVTTLALALGCLGVGQLNATGVPQSELVLRSTESVAGQEAIARHFDAGAGSPVFAVVTSDSASEAVAAATGTPGVASAFIQSADGSPVRPGAAPQVVEGRSLVSVTLSDAPDSREAEKTLLALRERLKSVDAEALVGGPTATAVDTQATAQADLVKIIPLILAAILVILMALLRSIVAPLVLIATTVLSYGTAMGVSALVFRYLLGFPAADPSVPLFGFVFLVALGVDYNIFLATRIREEALTHGPRTAITRGLAVTGGVITSAGVVLAATFAALGVIPIMFMVQLGFIVAFGVLLDTFVVRSLLVPAIAHELGRWLWWPSRLSRRPADNS
ncbi:MAG: MMPL family transporter [Propionibacteriaceae bacterium]|nr:MMPL family transporter [Propionibacteriaceae bacterium]